MVVVAARPARAALLMDDRRAHRPLAVALPEALRPPRARDAGRARCRGGLGRGVPALAPGALAPRHGRGDRGGPESLPHLPSLTAGGAPGHAPLHARAGRGHGDRGGRHTRSLARADARPARAGPRRASARAVARDDTALTLRFVSLASRPGGAAVRLRLPDRGLHPRAQA